MVAAARCLSGSLALRHLPIARPTRPEVESFTFSVVPGLTALWALLLDRSLDGRSHHLWIGDCSGGLRQLPGVRAQRSTIRPLLNLNHGVKLDLFMRDVCRAEYVVLSDDDVLWPTARPLEWALARMAEDPRLAVVSLVPRGRFTWTIDGREHVPMGSYCLVVRRSLWLAEKLSFRQVSEPSPNPKSYRGQYDTADYANVELLRRGLGVCVAPAEVRGELAVFKGVSSALLQIQKDPPTGFVSELYGAEQLIYAARVAERLDRIRIAGAPLPTALAPELQRKVTETLHPMLPAEKLAAVHASVDAIFDRITPALPR